MKQVSLRYRSGSDGGGGLGWRPMTRKETCDVVCWTGPALVSIDLCMLDQDGKKIKRQTVHGHWNKLSAELKKIKQRFDKALLIDGLYRLAALGQVVNAR